MKRVSLNSVHDFRKVNLVTQKESGGRMFDMLKCSKCGIKGKRYGVDEVIMVSNSYSDKKIKECDGSLKKELECGPDEYVGRKIKVGHVTVMNSAFDNLKPGTEHQVIVPPPDKLNGERGIWLQGIGEPVMLLFGEFVFVDTPNTDSADAVAYALGTETVSDDGWNNW